ncbi:PD-(D/E)XK nuclease family transposase [Pedobacter sp. UYP1]|uniref:PD-(D/E)XK nuclease family transposase n=1 Tax=Pedobacter sp. UYP1 TaxID=1756396 RepID=UPI003392802D
MSEKMNKYIDPLSDFGFKHLFGGEPNKDIMIGFLNAVFEGQKYITDITYSPTEYGGDEQDYRKVSFDLLCTGTQGEQFIVEMQRLAHSNFGDRCIFYLSRLIHQQKLLGKGNWNFKLKEVFLIAILDFKMKSSTNDHYLQSISLVNTGTGEIFHNGLGFKFLELPKFDKKEDELESELDKWVYVLKHMQSLGKIPEYLDKRIFQKIFNVSEMSRLTPEQRFIHDLDQQKKWEYQCVLDEILKIGLERGLAKGLNDEMLHGIEEGIEQEFRKGVLEGLEKGIKKGKLQGIEQGLEKGIQEGIEKGLEQGLEKGIQQGIEKGLEQGLEKGIQQGIEKGLEQGLEKGIQQGIEKGFEQGKLEISLELARKMKNENFDTLKIIQFTKLPIEVIDNL